MKNRDNKLGLMPKVGIRPVIDARLGGIRESLEEITMDIAERVAKFLSSNLKYYNGENIECIISATTIGRVPEAQLCEEKFLREAVGLSITVTPRWCYGTETIDMNPTRPKAIWGFNGTERPGAVYVSTALAEHTQKGLPAFSIYGHGIRESNDKDIPKDVKLSLIQFTKSGLPVAAMKGKSYLSIGSVSMEIAGSIVNEDFF